MFRLALALGQPDPYALADAMPPGLLREWQAFDEVEPISTGKRVDAQTGMLLSFAANMLRGEDVTPFRPADFMPVWGPLSTTGPQGTAGVNPHPGAEYSAFPSPTNGRGEEKEEEYPDPELVFTRVKAWALMAAGYSGGAGGNDGRS